MSNGTNENWVLVKLTRWENGHNTSSAPLPVAIDAGSRKSELRAVYKKVWDYFTELEKDIARPRDRKNLPAGAGPRASDGIEGLSVNWQGVISDEWSAKEETVITEKNLDGILQRLLKTPNAVIHCIVKETKLGDVEWSPASN
ncbi:hypothetical protein DSL72_001373 [Monilinia vaccinii-corymbosi]|uniref:Uncharacterized protein n=1 Tax=Monilinia vaccinii-corymbosi TaxID=61207 RepID=A0A8A3P5V6_9HELO|nr:hypothetical protein DSL72_001373 [Monilinia vaccinii-corymbosi]